MPECYSIGPPLTDFCVQAPLGAVPYHQLSATWGESTILLLSLPSAEQWAALGRSCHSGLVSFATSATTSSDAQDLFLFVVSSCGTKYSLVNETVSNIWTFENFANMLTLLSIGFGQSFSWIGAMKSMLCSRWGQFLLSWFDNLTLGLGRPHGPQPWSDWKPCFIWSISHSAVSEKIHQSCIFLTAL